MFRATMRALETIRAIDLAGEDIRVWCFECARGKRIDAIIWQLFEERGWDMETEAARGRFRCAVCRSAAHTLIVPATRPKRDISNAPTDLVAGYFHTMRSQGKRARRNR